MVSNVQEINERVEAHKGLAVNIARAYAGQGVNFDIIIQAGLLGMMKASEKYDPSRGSFAQFCVWYIKQAIDEELAEQSAALSLYRLRELRRYNRARNILWQELGREPTVEQIAAKMDVSVKRLQALLQRRDEPLSIETWSNTIYPDDDHDITILTSLAASERISPEQICFRRSLRELLLEKLQLLSAPERDAIVLRFGLRSDDPLTLMEIEKELGIDYRVVDYKVRRGLKKLRSLCQDLKDFLD